MKREKKKYLIRINKSTYILKASRINLITTNLRDEAKKINGFNKAKDYCRKYNITTILLRSAKYEGKSKSLLFTRLLLCECRK